MNKLLTELDDRVLRYDGVSVVSVEQAAGLLLRGVQPNQLRLAEETEEAAQFNEQVAEPDKLRVVEEEPINIDLRWHLPERFANINLESYFAEITPRSLEAALRVGAELEEVKKRGMEQLIRTIIYVLDVFKRNKIVWGVGRGSSCASYLLFLLGLHVVDCVKLDVPMEEFFHD